MNTVQTVVDSDNTRERERHNDGIDIDVKASEDDLSGSSDEEDQYQETVTTPVSENESQVQMSNDNADNDQITEAIPSTSSWRNNREIQQMLTELVSSRVEQEVNQRLQSLGHTEAIATTAKRSANIKGTLKGNNNDFVKSPSDTTIYAPGLSKKNDQEVVQQISEFVESIRLDAQKNDQKHDQDDTNVSDEEGEVTGDASDAELPHNASQASSRKSTQSVEDQSRRGASQSQTRSRLRSRSRSRGRRYRRERSRSRRRRSRSRSDHRRRGGRDRSRSRSRKERRSRDRPRHEKERSRDQDRNRDRMWSDDTELTAAKKISDNIVLEAEKFRANITAPQGKEKFSDYYYESEEDEEHYDFASFGSALKLPNELMLRRLFDSDDDFFHVTGHLDPVLKAKIERGEFVELEKLLPKDKYSMHNVSANEPLFQLIRRDGQTYLGNPSMSGEGRINSIRRWEQAFRTYAAVYTTVHPERSGEIWQYVHTINTAAQSYNWDNIYYYNITFRELMACKPWRSWSKVYAQGWNLALRDNNVRSNNYSAGNSGNFASGSSGSGDTGGGSGSGSGSKTRSWKDDCCWCYNKGSCKRTGSECKYNHRCTHCSGWGHPHHACRKRSVNNRGCTSNTSSNASSGNQASAPSTSNNSNTGGKK